MTTRKTEPHTTKQHDNPAPDTPPGNSPLETMSQDYSVQPILLDEIYVEGGQDDEGVVAALAESVDSSGLLQHITVVENNIPDHPAKYRLLFGRKRLAAYLAQQRTTIPARILDIPEGGVDKECWIARLRMDENLVRKHYSLTEMCELVGQHKESYERTYPYTMHGRAPKRRKGSEIESFTESYRKYIAGLLHKSPSTVWNYVYIYNNLIQPHPQVYALLKQHNHPILGKLGALLELARSEDIEALSRLLCGLGLTSDDNESKPCTLREAQERLEQYRAQSGHESNQSPDKEGLPGETTVAPSPTQDSGTDGSGMAQDAPQNQPTPRANTPKSQESDTPISPTEHTRDQPSAPDTSRDIAQAPAEPLADQPPAQDSGTDVVQSPAESTVDQSSAQDSGTDGPEVAHPGATPHTVTRHALRLDHLLRQQQAELRGWFEDLQDPHVFSVKEMKSGHNTLRVVFTSTLSQPEDVTDRPDKCPGWGLHNASMDLCRTCPYTTRCEEAQTVLVDQED